MELGTSSSSGLVKAKSETLSEALKSSSLDFSNSDGSSKQNLMARTLSSPSHSSSSKNRRNTHIRKAKSAHPALDLASLTGGAALSRASSASLGLSFSFTGFTVPHEEIISSKRSCSNDDILEDIEAATSNVGKIQTEPTFPIYLKSSLGGSTTIYWFSATCEAELHAGPKGS